MRRLLAAASFRSAVLPSAVQRNSLLCGRTLGKSGFLNSNFGALALGRKQTCGCGLCFPLSESSCRSRVARLQQHRAFSSSSSPAEALRDTVQKELAHEQSNFEPDKSLNEFLTENGWKLEEKEHEMIVTLSKTVEGRQVAVEFSCIQPSGGEEEALLEACDFTVTVSSGSGAESKGVVFYCSTTSEEESARFCIGQVRIFTDAASRDSVNTYPGPYFEDLDDAFQESLDKWLASLGVDEKLCDFIERFSAQKENSEYIKWLQQLSAFVVRS